MMRKIGAAANAGSRRPQKAPAPKSKDSRRQAVQSAPARRRKNSAESPALPMTRPPPPGQGKRGEQGHLAYLLRQAQAATRLAMERALADLGATPPQFVVLTMLRAYPGLSGAELARVAMLTPQTTGVIIRNLERDGAIRKTPHPVHGRVLQWTVTRRGAALLDKCRRHAQVIERRLVAGLSANGQRTIRRWLAQIAADL
jgi:DNA-binding MarR family transcriptional regulator